MLCLISSIASSTRPSYSWTISYNALRITHLNKSYPNSFSLQLGVTKNDDDINGDSYATSDFSSKGIVSTLTNLVNFVVGEKENISNNYSTISTRTKEQNDQDLATSISSQFAKSPQDLMRFIEEDYTIKNYLWTGDIHLPVFEEDCRFTDPTLSFVGTSQFVKNVKNLVPIVEWLTKDGTRCRSELLNISLNTKEQYVQTRWNMVGDLSSLPWKPGIDVIGRTKFWYRNSDGPEGNCYKVYFYDEEWELKTWKALLQLISKKGTIPSSDIL